MRLLILGVDAQGRSCVVEQRDVVTSPISGLVGSSIAKLFSIDQSPPPPVVKGFGKYLPNALPPGHVSWYVIDHAPRVSDDEHSAATELHYRDAVDLVFILEGGGDMLLDDGAHPVVAGDCIVMEGTDHGLRPGNAGCRLMAFAIGAQRA
jgi:hypothetical protein